MPPITKQFTINISPEQFLLRPKDIESESRKSITRRTSGFGAVSRGADEEEAWFEERIRWLGMQSNVAPFDRSTCLLKTLLFVAPRAPRSRRQGIYYTSANSPSRQEESASTRIGTLFNLQPGSHGLAK